LLDSQYSLIFDTAPLFLIAIEPDSISIPFVPSIRTTPVPCGVSPILPFPEDVIIPQPVISRLSPEGSSLILLFD
jgi:hypothetical protein